VEAAELMEHFLWVDVEASRQVALDPAQRVAIGEEMADVACYLLALANTLQLDLSDAILDKLAKNAVKYPVERYRGRFQ
jgi:NTP pyrophosphatase (non-canonical NTP hydrolase)